MSKTWFKTQVRCPHCGYLALMRIYKNVPPICPNCEKQMNVVEKEE